VLVAHPLPAEIDRLTAERLRQRSTTDAIARLEHDHRPCLRELVRGCQTGNAGADDDHVGVHGADHRIGFWLTSSVK
jgi:hypothetical protein